MVAIIETLSSGAVVASETSTIPITTLGILNRSAAATELSTNMSAHFAKTQNAAARTPHAISG